MKLNMIARATLMALGTAVALMPSAVTAQTKKNVPPVPVVSWQQFPGEPILIFSGGDSTDAEGPVVAWSWKFGDGKTGTGPDASHTYAKAGNYTATLTVKDSAGASASKNFAVTVVGKPNVPPFTRLA